MSTSTVRFSISCYPESWDVSYDGVIAAKHGCKFVSEGDSCMGVDYHSVVIDAPTLEAAEAFVTEVFSCDESCTAEELMDVIA